MAMCDYAQCHKCHGKAFYDANISDPGYCATWDPSEEADPIGIAVLCAECAKTYEAVILPIERDADGDLLRAAKAVLARWDSSDWNAPPSPAAMNLLRAAVIAAEAEHG